MKTTLFLNRTAWLLIVLLPTACHKNSEDTPAPVPTCTLSSYTSVTQEAGSRQTSTGQFDFDAGNRLIRTTETDEFTGSIVRTGKSVTDYQYDSGGFLTESARTYTSKYTSGSSNSASTTTFAYSDNRLSQTITKSTSSGTTTTTTSTETYQYDGQGKLSQYAIVSGSGSNTSRKVYLFSGGLLTSVSSDGRELYQIENGRILATKDGTTRYDYDSQGRRIGYNYTSGTSKSATSYEYEPVGHPYQTTQPQLQFKGVPYNQLLAVFGLEDALVKRQTQTSELNGKITSSVETTYAYQLNPKGYPLSQTEKSTSTYTDPTGVTPPVNYTTNTTLQFTYRTCD